MSDMATFSSRTGRLNCAPKKVFDFVTDIRNFQQFIPDDTISNLTLEKESCSFQVPPLGTVDMQLSGKEPYSKVSFAGTALKTNSFLIFLHIADGIDGKAEVKISLDARMNPILKMMAEEPIKKFLEILIDKMENFGDWESFKG